MADAQVTIKTHSQKWLENRPRWPIIAMRVNAVSWKSCWVIISQAPWTLTGWAIAAHGGEFFKDDALVTDETLAQIERLAELVPASQPGKTRWVFTFRQPLPDAPFR